MFLTSAQKEEQRKDFKGYSMVTTKHSLYLLARIDYVWFRQEQFALCIQCAGSP